MVEYRLYLRDGGTIRARQGFVAGSDTEAREIAELTFQACSDRCSSYELWSGTRLVLESSSKDPRCFFEVLTEINQQRVVEFEERLRDSHWLVGKSPRLGEAIDAARKSRVAVANTSDRALVVEDDEPARKWMTRLVLDAGFEVVEADDFRPALAVIQDGKPLRLLISDVVLPGLSGFALGRMARMVHKNLRSVYVSAYDVTGGEAIIGPVLRKPLGPDELMNTVREVLAA